MDPRARIVFRTQGVCPAEIHFRLNGDTLESLRFAGGGCPGNATVLSRLLPGRTLSQLVEELSGIRCQKGTSCPDQLAQALAAAQRGELVAAPPPRLEVDPVSRQRVGLVGELGGDRALLRELVAEMRAEGVESIYSLGKLRNHSTCSADLLADLRAAGIRAIAGEDDSRPCPASTTGNTAAGELPHLLAFHLGSHPGVAFFGEYVLQLPGFSDFDPFSLEITQVCSLTRCMQEDSLFPALEAMTGQFQSRVVLFGQPQKWGHWQVGGVDFISVGPARVNDRPSWGLLEIADGEPRFELQTVANRSDRV